MESIHSQLLAALEAYTLNSEKFEGGNKSAGTRARKALSDLTKLAKERRKEIQASKNAG